MAFPLTSSVTSIATRWPDAFRASQSGGSSPRPLEAMSVNGAAPARARTSCKDFTTPNSSRSAAAQKKGDRSFEVNALRLLATVNEATEDGVLASNGIIAPAIKASLAEQIPSFEPVDKVLWSRQSVHALSQAVGCLGYAYMMVDRADLAREVLLEAVKRFPGDGQLGRVCLESCFRAGSGDDAFDFGKANLRASAVRAPGCKRRWRSCFTCVGRCPDCEFGVSACAGTSDGGTDSCRRQSSLATSSLGVDS